MAKQDTGVVDIRGKQYQTVALRVQMFRERHPTWALVTEVMERDEKCVVVRASISDDTGRVLATGHAEEYRASSSINKTSALENAETSAIGRALAGLGLGGTEFASADEVAHAINGKPAAPPMREIDQDIETLSVSLREAAAIGPDELFSVWSNASKEEKAAVWPLLDPTLKSSIRDMSKSAA